MVSNLWLSPSYPTIIACPCMIDCYDGCENCDNPICDNPMTEKDVLVLSTFYNDKTPMIISFDGKQFVY